MKSVYVLEISDVQEPEFPFIAGVFEKKEDAEKHFLKEYKEGYLKCIMCFDLK